MAYLIAGLAVFGLILLFSRKISSVPASQLAVIAKTVGGVICLLIAGVLGLFGRLAFAAPIGALGLALLSGRSLLPSGMRSTPSPGGTSSVSSKYLKMELDHDTGDMNGTVTSGQYAGSELKSLEMRELYTLYIEIDDDLESLQLLEAYLDRREPGWREDIEVDTDIGSGRTAQSGPMSEQEAYEVLGLNAGASKSEIRAAHRRLMAALHPDRGGSTYLASKINLAKDVLLARHG
jgi:hypothetical protein